MAEGTIIITLSNQSPATPAFDGTFITGWHVPTDVEYVTLRTFIDPIGDALINNAGINLKEMGFIHWTDSGVNANDGLNTFGFKAIGAGVRSGGFSLQNKANYLWTSDPASAIAAYIGLIEYNKQRYLVGNNTSLKLYGASIRLIKDDSNNPITVTDYDGNIYPTVKIGTQVWMAANLATTHYADGTAIPIVTDNAAWAALTTAGMCYYNNTP